MKRPDSSAEHFGYRKVAGGDKQRLVNDVFSSVAENYDLMNDLMSLGLHRWWKRYAVQLAAVREGFQVLDLAGGTGDMTALLEPHIGSDGKIVLSDINPEMLDVGRQRLLDRGIVRSVDYIQADARQLPFADDHFDLTCIAFGIRNVANKETALLEIYRIIKPRGKLLILEFSKPQNPLLSKLYDLYSFTVLPTLGQLVANDADSYRYLAESIRMHPDQQQMKQMILDAGFQSCEFFNLLDGIVTVHRGVK